MLHVRQKVRSQRSDVAFNIILYAACTLLLLLILYPLWFIVIASFSDPSAVAGGHVWLLPVGFTLDGYEELLKQANVWIGYRNTIAYTLVGTLIALAVNIPAAIPSCRSRMSASRRAPISPTRGQSTSRQARAMRMRRRFSIPPRSTMRRASPA